MYYEKTDLFEEQPNISKMANREMIEINYASDYSIHKVLDVWYLLKTEDITMICKNSLL